MNIATRRQAEPASPGLVSPVAPALVRPFGHPLGHPLGRVRWARLATALAVPAIMLLTAVGCRWLGLLHAVIDTDEGLYMVQAREWLRGAWPLVAVWDMHPIGAPALFALAFAVFGEGVLAVRLLGILAAALAGTAVFAAVRAAGAPRALGIGAGIIYVAHTARMGGLASNTEILFAPLVATAMAIGIGATAAAWRWGNVLRAQDLAAPRARDLVAPRARDLVAMGLAIGLALAIKPVAAPEGCLAFALLVGPAWWRGLLGWRRALGFAAGYAALCALPTLLIGLAYWLRGDLAAFVDGSFLAPLRYSHGRLLAWDALHRVTVAALTLLWPLLLAGLALAHWLPRPGSGGLLARIGLLWFATATIAIVGPGFYFPHYFLMWLPPLAVLAALGCWHLARLAVPRPKGHDRGHIQRRQVGDRGGHRGRDMHGLDRRGLVFALLVAAVAVGSWRADATARIDRGIGTFAADPVREVAAAVARELAPRGNPGETIFVANYHPVVYVLSGAGLPTRYVFPAHLTGAFGRVADIDMDVEVARILATRPLVVVVDRGWWASMRAPVAAMITTALAGDYTLAATVAEERGAVEVWRRR